MLIALDRTDDKQHHQEFDYMWTEAQQKIRDNEVNSMTEDQKLLGQVTYADVAYCLYWGKRCSIADGTTRPRSTSRT